MSSPNRRLNFKSAAAYPQNRRMSGIIERDIPKDELYGEESWISSEPTDPCAELFPSFRSYSSLESLSCDGLDEEERRLCKLNNAIKKLADVIDDSILGENTAYVSCLIRKFLKYNGMEAYVSLKMMI